MQVTLGTTAVRVALSAGMRGDSRRPLVIRNIGTATAYVGTDRRVTTSGPLGGFPVNAGEMLDDLELNGDRELWAVADAPTVLAVELFDRPEPGVKR